MVITPEGALYVANYNDGNIFQLSENGEATLLAHIDGPDFFNIGYMTYASDNLYATGIGAHQLFKVTMQAKFQFSQEPVKQDFLMAMHKQQLLLVLMA